MLKKELLALLMASFAVGLYSQQGTSPDWPNLRVHSSLEALQKSLETSAARVPILKEVRPKIQPYLAPVEKAVDSLKSRLNPESSDNSTSPSTTEGAQGVDTQPEVRESTVGSVTAPSTGGEVNGNVKVLSEVKNDKPLEDGTVVEKEIPGIPGFPNSPDFSYSREHNDTTFRFRFQYRLKKAGTEDVTP